MELAKLTIRVETDPGNFDHKALTVLFNPNKIAIQKSAKWGKAAGTGRDVPNAQFAHGEPASLSLELFYDTYESRQDVQAHTREIYALTTIENHGDLHRPPLCKLEWGLFRFQDFQWVLQSLNQTFTLFLENGTPVRATLGCSFKQWRSDEIEAKLLNKQSADVPKTRIVQRGDTLSQIAGAEYNDPYLWRPIAKANDIDNPYRLVPGQVLAIPTLTTRQRRRR
jgi:nucleoid-associated protein YgaU